jgi:2-oxoglutarate ferredoxin oxidoreductase subunit alpha
MLKIYIPQVMLKSPLEDGSLEGYKVFEVPITTLTTNALKDSPLSPKEVVRCKNFFALGMMYWLYNRPMEPTLDWIKAKFKKFRTLLMQTKKR